MTPAAQYAAAIEIIDAIEAGQPAEQALTRWARGHRFAGSKDRAAIRDHVFDVLRCWRSSAYLGGGEEGRARILGKLRRDGTDPGTVFTGVGHAPAPLHADELNPPADPPDLPVSLDLPDWLVPPLEASLGEAGLHGFAETSQGRAPVTLRVNTLKATPAEMIQRLAEEGITATPNPLSPVALTVTEGARKLRNSAAYQQGFVELQDASSQAVVDLLPGASRVLDYCAGGGGKALAIAAKGSGQVFAHDIDPARMKDLPARGERAGVEIIQLETDGLSDAGPFDLVLVDAPCSGSGAWRRAPEGKWRLTEDRLDALCAIQDDVLEAASDLVAPGGTLAYATCSVLRRENEERVAHFLDSYPDWLCQRQDRLDVSAQGDGFFTAHLTRRG